MADVPVQQGMRVLYSRYLLYLRDVVEWIEGHARLARGFLHLKIIGSTDIPFQGSYVPRRVLPQKVSFFISILFDFLCHRPSKTLATKGSLIFPGSLLSLASSLLLL